MTLGQSEGLVNAVFLRGRVDLGFPSELNALKSSEPNPPTWEWEVGGRDPLFVSRSLPFTLEKEKVLLPLRTRARMTAVQV
jgi:hypothetical protein